MSEFDLDYGTDFSTAVIGPDGRMDIDPMFRVISGPRVVLEAVARRLQTPRGMLEDDPGFGVDITSLLNSNVDISVIEHVIKAECEADERVNSAAIAMDFNKAASTLGIKIDLNLSVGVFRLVLTYDSLTSKVGVIFPNG